MRGVALVLGVPLVPLNVGRSTDVAKLMLLWTFRL